jgi:Domain of unknown function (DUF4440)
MNHGMGRVAVVGAVLGVALVTVGMPARPQHAQWASENDPNAKYMIDMERQWAEAGCKNQPVGEKFIADDFQGTAPSGERYDKAEALKIDSSANEHDCHLDEAKVRFFGENVALIYGSERARRKATDGGERVRCLVWTDTWLRRNGKWQIVAAQDTDTPCR